MSKILLDTNTVSALFRGDKSILDALATADCVHASVVVIGELEAGFRNGNRYSRNLSVLDRFLSKPTVKIAQITRETSECFGRIKTALKAKGKPIPINDVWIAAQCVELGAVLVTYDEHFLHIDGLRILGH